jgi:potassium-transporting ATPase KdpC subunit
MKSLKMFIWLSLLVGVIYPFLVTAIALLAMPAKATGSFIINNGQIVGSTLIAQKFENEGYFWPRPSAIDYNPLPSGGSNLGPTSLKLKQQVEKRREKYHAQEIPSELLFASGSGLDPHLSPEAAYFQVERIAHVRQIKSERVKELIDSFIHKRHLGFLGKKCVNVLKLNLALDQEGKKV